MESCYRPSCTAYIRSTCIEMPSVNFSPSTEVAYAAITLHVVLAFPVPFHACAETLESVLGVREKVQAPETDCFRLRLR